MALLFAGLTIPAAKSVNAAASPRTLTLAADRAIIPVVYGQCRVSGLVLNVIAGASAGTTLVQVLWAHAGHELSAFKWNGQDIPSGATVTHYTGSQTSADAALVAAFAAQGITYSDTLAGYAYSVFALPTVLFTGQLELTAWFKGRKLYDVRKDSTAGGTGSHRLATPSTWEWSENPSLALADWITNAAYGAGESVNWSSVGQAANANDQLIGSPAEKRRVIGLCLNSAARIEDTAEALRAYAGCWLVATAAGTRLVPDADASPVAAYSHSSGDIAEISALQLPDRSAAPTVMEVVYTDDSTGEAKDASAVVELSGAGVSIPWRLSKVQLPGIRRYSQALREATERLNKLTLEGVATTLEVFDVGIRHERGDIISVTHPVGLSAASMRVVDVEMPGPGRWRLQLMRHDPLAYSSDVVAAPSDSASNRVIDAGPASTVSGVTGAMVNGTLRIRWAPCPDVGYECTEIRTTDGDWASNSTAPLYRGNANEFGYIPTSAATYTFYLRHISNAKVSSASATVTVIVTAGDLGDGTTAPDLTPPPTPSGLTASAGVSSVTVQWTAPTYTVGRGNAYTRIYAAQWVAGTSAPTFGDTRTKLVEAAPEQQVIVSYPSNPSVTWCIWAKFYSRDGVESATPAGGANGVQVTTGQDVSSLLDALTGEIRASELSSSLSARIDLIDAPTTGLVAQVDALEATYGSTASAAASAAAAAASAANAAASDAAAAQSEADALLAQTGAQTARDQAVTAKTSAETAASSAQTSATNAASSATGAAGSASAASTSATAAANSATAAGGSAGAAATSATNAATSATNAGNSATASQSARVAAESARDAASGSASAAAGSASTATTKATEAGTSASAAQTSATNAASSADGAASSATAAAGSATSAATSATASGNSATAAQTAKVAAESARDAAAGSASAAATSAATATTKATEAGNSATSAQTSATSASTSAGTATTKAGEAATSATNAAASAGSASTSATAASTSATNAAGSASSASTSATNAANSATAAGGSATAAAGSASTATTQATNASNSASAANTAKVAAESARDAASGSATAAATSASTATTKASEAGTSATAAAASATSAATSASSAQTYASNASTSATNAAGSASTATTQAGAASTSATNAGNSASAAATSASNASTSATNASNSAAAAASTLEVVKATATGFDSAIAWNFDSSADGWSGISTTVSATGGYIRVSGSSDPIIVSPSISLSGGTNTVIRARIRRIAGSGWQGQVYYNTAGHGHSESYTKTAANDTVLNEWRVIEWDMAALTAGGSDWTSSTITGIRLDIGAGSGDTFDVDWVTIGRIAPAAYGAAIATEQAARVALDNSVQALYTVRAEVSAGGRTVVGGFGLAATSTAAGGARVDFGVRADRFYVDAPAGSGVTSQIVPFVVQTSGFTEGGVSRPAGVYMDAAYIKNLTAVYATVQSLVADQISAASISVAKLVAGSLNVGAYIQSGGFTSGSGASPGTGFRISGNGSAEFNNVVARGTIYATAGAIGGNVLGSDYIQSSNFNAGTAGWRLKSDGSAEFGAAAIRGKLTASQIQVGTITVGGTNILRNGDFKLFTGSLPTDFTLYNDAGVSISTGPTAGFVSNTQWCYLQGNAPTSSSFGLSCDAVAGFGGFKPATTYIISWYAQVIADNGPTGGKGLLGKTMQMAWAVSPAEFEMLVNPALNTLPQRYVARVNFQFGSVDTQFRISKLIDGTSTHSGDVLYLGAMQVEVGESPSGWSPAAITSLNQITTDNVGLFMGANAVTEVLRAFVSGPVTYSTVS